MDPKQRGWAQVSFDERMEMFAEAMEQQPGETAEARARVMERVRAHLQARPNRARDFYFCTNVWLRECWREQHGSTREWDRVARESGRWI
jgi:hypothetical protein